MDTNMNPTSGGKNVLSSDVEIKGNLRFGGELLFEGKILKQGTAEELAADETVRKVYLGKNFELRRAKV